MIKKLILVIAFILVIMTSGCEQKVSEEQDVDKDEKQETVSGIDSEYIHLAMVKADTINPVLNKDKSVGYVMNLVYDSLFTIDENYDVVPQLVKEHGISSDGKNINIVLNDAKWHNGDNLTSYDVKFTVDLIKKNSQSPYYPLVKDIESVYVSDNKTLNIKFKEAYAFSTETLIFPIVSQSELSNKSSEDILKDNNNLVGSGKYKIDRYKPRESMILSVNEDYYEDIPKKMRDIEIKIVPDYESQVAMAIALSSDIVNIDLDDMSKFYEKEFDINMYEGRDYEQIIFNYENEFLRNENFRKAIAHSIDRELILKEAYIGYGEIVNFPLNSNSKYYDEEIKGIEYDLDLAKEYLGKSKPEKEEMKSFIKEDEETKETKEQPEKEETESKDNKKEEDIDLKEIISTLNLKIAVNKNNKERLKTAHIVSDSLKSIGIKSTVNELTDDEMDKALKDKSYDIAIVGWELSSTSDASSIIKNSGYYDSKLDGYLKSLKKATNEKQIKDIYTSIQKYIVEKVPFISLVNRFDYVVTNKRIEGEIKSNEFDIYEGIEELDIKK